MSAPNPNVQRVPKLLLCINEWVASSRLTKEQGQQLSNLTLAKNDGMMQLADEIGTTPDAELLTKALALKDAPAAAASSSSGSGDAPKQGGRKGRPALNIGAVKDANATADAARVNEAESQADALLKAKRMRNLKRQSLPERGLPESVADQLS